jgi:hypothetical protein
VKAWQQRIVDEYPEPFLRGLLHSDGCRAMNVAVIHHKDGIKRYHYPRYHFSNRSEDILALFCRACEKIGDGWKRANFKDVTVNRREDVARLDEFVGPKH